MMIKIDEKKTIQGQPGPGPGQKFMWHECWRAICLR